jgi:hypothetical protein
MKWVYDISTDAFICGGPYEPVCNPVTQRIVELSHHPDPRTERYDGAGGIRPATAEEVSDYDVAQKDAQSLSRFDDEQLVKALAIWTAGKLNVPLAQAKQEILAIYRGLI